MTRALFPIMLGGSFANATFSKMLFKGVAMHDLMYHWFGDC